MVGGTAVGGRLPRQLRNGNPGFSTLCASGEPWGGPGHVGAAGLGEGGRAEVGAGCLQPGIRHGGAQTTGMCLHRRTGKVGLSGMAIADITLLSGFHALRADLEKV